MALSDPAPIIPPPPVVAALQLETETGQEAPQGATFRPLAPRQRGRAAPPPGGAQGAQGAPLGSRTPSVSTHPPDPARKQRGVLRRYQLQESAAELLQQHRVRWCACVPTKQYVGVLYHPEHAGASYSGLAYCGSAWVCPLCASKIMARRAADLAAGIASWQAAGGHVYMVTFTLRHQRGQRLKFLLEAMNEALRKMHGSGAWPRLAARYDLAGTVTGREMTHGKNGWHPHIHSLFFTRKPLSNDALTVLEGQLFHSWARQLSKFNLDATKEYGINITAANDKASEYVTKCAKTWSVSQEMVNQLAKEGRRGNRTPQELLVLYSKGDKRAGELYKEYADATRRKRPLFWSQGLWQEVFGSIPEKTDEEILSEQEATAEEIIVLTHEQWSKIVRYRLRGDLLAEAIERKPEQLVSWLASCGITLASWQLSYTLQNKSMV